MTNEDFYTVAEAVKQFFQTYEDYKTYSTEQRWDKMEASKNNLKRIICEALQKLEV